MVAIKWSDVALTDVERIAEFIALDDRVAANTFVDRIFNQVELLVDFPDLGLVVHELKDSLYRELLVAPARVIYRRHEDVIMIIRVLRFEQRYDTANFILK